jgi:FtsP/CotA-like multicopper oxidase with cupredoxin domain
VIRGEHDHWRVRDRVFVLQTPEWDAEGKLKTFTPGLLRSQLRLVNGRLNPTIDIRHGETQRWRFVNASVNSVFKLALEGPVACRAAFPSWPVSPVPLLQPFHDLRKRRVERKRELRFSITGGFHINGKAFDENRVDETVELGAIEEWTVYNDSGLMHPFHIHINPFQLTHVNGQPVDEPGYYDTYPVDPNGSITFRTHFMDFTGKSFFHCHLILHSDIGMMGVFEVVRRRKPWASAEDQYDALCEIA